MSSDNGDTSLWQDAYRVHSMEGITRPVVDDVTVLVDPAIKMCALNDLSERFGAEFSEVFSTNAKGPILSIQVVGERMKNGPFLLLCDNITDLDGVILGPVLTLTTSEAIINSIATKSDSIRAFLKAIVAEL